MMRGPATEPIVKTNVEINNPAPIAVVEVVVTGEVKEVKEAEVAEVVEAVGEAKTKIARGRSE